MKSKEDLRSILRAVDCDKIKATAGRLGTDFHFQNWLYNAVPFKVTLPPNLPPPPSITLNGNGTQKRQILLICCSFSNDLPTGMPLSLPPITGYLFFDCDVQIELNFKSPTQYPPAFYLTKMKQTGVRFPSCLYFSLVGGGGGRG